MRRIPRNISRMQTARKEKNRSSPAESYLLAHGLARQDRTVLIVNVGGEDVSVVYAQHRLNYVIRLHQELLYLCYQRNTIVIDQPTEYILNTYRWRCSIVKRS